MIANISSFFEIATPNMPAGSFFVTFLRRHSRFLICFRPWSWLGDCKDGHKLKCLDGSLDAKRTGQTANMWHLNLACWRCCFVLANFNEPSSACEKKETAVDPNVCLLCLLSQLALCWLVWWGYWKQPFEFSTVSQLHAHAGEVTLMRMSTTPRLWFKKDVTKYCGLSGLMLSYFDFMRDSEIAQNTPAFQSRKAHFASPDAALHCFIARFQDLVEEVRAKQGNLRPEDRTITA